MIQEQEVLTFFTDGQWSTKDLEVFARSISAIYDARLATYLWSHRATADSQNRRDTLQKLLRKFKQHLHGPALYEWAEAWMDILEQTTSPDVEALAIFPMPLRVSLPFDLVTPSNILQALDLYAREDERCRVQRARMSSPGGFSFTGIGEILKEFRELIKDIWYRNRQEKMRGDLEVESARIDVIEKYLSLRERLSTSQQLVVNVSEGIDGLVALEQNGKLKSIAENIDKPADF